MLRQFEFTTYSVRRFYPSTEKRRKSRWRRCRHLISLNTAFTGFQTTLRKLSTGSSTVYEIDVFPCTPQKRWWSRKRWCPSKITAFTAFYTFSLAVLKKCHGWVCSRSQNCRVLCREACKNCLNWSPNRPTSRFFGVRSDRVHDAKPPVQNQNPGSDLDGCLKLCTRPCIFWGGYFNKVKPSIWLSWLSPFRGGDN